MQAGFIRLIPRVTVLAFLDSALNLFFYSVVILAVHLLVALAAARGWKALVTPGIMCGILGYAIGAFIGVAVAKLLM